VTGASRGIGKAAAIALAERGFDVVVTARTTVEGQAADGTSVSGSIETTAQEVRARGRQALPIRLDLLDRTSIDAAVQQTLDRWGAIDVLVNNGIYTGPATMERFLAIDEGEVARMFDANVLAQIHLTRLVLPQMLERGSGSVVNMISNAGLNDPPAAAGEGGWGYAYAATKAALTRMAGVLAVEHGGSGVCFFNVEPGFVATEAMALYDSDGTLAKRYRAAPTSVPGAVVGWLAADPAAVERNGKIVFAQKLALELGLVPDWR